MARTVALTGATGFVGGHLIRSLAETGWNIRALTRHFDNLIRSAIVGPDQIAAFIRTLKVE